MEFDGSSTMCGTAPEERRSKRRAIELRETREMLDQGGATLVRGSHGTGFLATGMPEDNLLVGSFPKVGVRSMFPARDPDGTLRRIDDDLNAGVQPCEVGAADGALYRLRGAPLPPVFTFDFEVAWLYKQKWQVNGGPWRYAYLGADNQPVQTSFEIETTSVEGQEGWIALVVEGELQFQTADSTFKLGHAPRIEFVRTLKTDFDLKLSGGFAEDVVGTYGHLPIAYVAAPGIHSARPLILHGASPNWQTATLRPHIHFATWGNSDW